MNYALDALLYGMQFRKLLEKKMKYVEKEYGLNRIDAQILFFLKHAGEHNTSSDMMKLQMFTRGHISQALSRLQKKGYIRMEQDMEDRRCTHNYLTKDAQDIIEKIAASHENIYNIILKDVTQEERDMLMTVVQKINKNINEVLSV